MLKKLMTLMTAFAVSAALITVQPVFASGDNGVIAAAVAIPGSEPVIESESNIHTSVEYQAYEQIAGYIAERYLDDSYTAEDIMKLGLSKYLAEHGDEALVELLKKAMKK